MTAAPKLGNKPHRKLVQVTLQFVFTEVDEKGELGELQPVQLNLSGKEWNNGWSSDQSREAVANIITQLDNPQKT